MCVALTHASKRCAWKPTLYLLYFIVVVVAADFIPDTATIRLKLWSSNHEKCTTDTTHCVPIAPDSNRTCLGNRLPYELTAPHPLVEDVSRYDLELWTALRSIPACWDKLQFFLCSVYVPECIEAVQQTSASSSTKPLASLNNSTTTVLNAVLAPLSLLESAAHSDEKSSDASSRTNSATSSSRVVLPEAEMCEAVHKACPLLVPFSRTDSKQAEAHGDTPVHNPIMLLLHPLPRFLDCSLYTPGCRQNKLTAQLFRSSGGGCEAPLITTTVRRNWLNEIERCSFPCRRPHFDEEHYSLARWITGTATVVCILVNLVVLATLKLQNSERMSFMEQFAALHPPTESGLDLFRLMVLPSERKSTRSYHTKVVLASAGGSSTSRFPWTNLSTTYPALFCIHVCFLLGCFAWLIPLFPGWGELVACREDGSVRTGEPQVSSGKTVLCVLDFILLYFPLMSVCVWSNVLDYTLFCRLRQVIQHLHVTLETLGASSQLSCPKKRLTLVTADPASTEPSSRHRSQDNPNPCGRDGSSIRQSSRHRRSKVDEFSDPRSAPPLPSSATQQQQTDDFAKSPVDTSESTSTAPLAGSTATQAETSLSQSISESSPSGADIVAVSGHSIDQVAPSHSLPDPTKLHTASRRKPFAPQVVTDSAAEWRVDKHRGGSTSRKKHKKPRTMSAGVDDELIPLRQFSGDQHLCDSQWSIVDQHYRSLVASLTDNNPLESLTQEPRGIPADLTGFELRAGDWPMAGPSLQCSFCHDPLCPSVPHPLTFHAISSVLQLKTRPFQSRCDRHAHSSGRKHTSDPGSGCPGCTGAGKINNAPGLDAVRTQQGRPLQSSPQSACLHLLAFALPLVLTLIGLTAAEIDGDALAGICFVGRVNVWARIGLVLVPCAVCLIVKCLYLGQVMRLCMRLRRPFLRSPFPSDQEFAQRLVRCTYSYGVFLFVLVGLWLFSVSVQTYTFVGEPMWLESQTALILCQISHRLMGLDTEAALTACVDSTSADSSKPVAGLYHPPPDPHEADRVARVDHSPSRTVRSLLGASGLPTASPDPTAVERKPLMLGRHNLYTPTAVPIHKPMAGPILLHLLTYFVLNVIFASMCLLDSSVKRSWYKCWIRFRVSCRLGNWRRQIPGQCGVSHAPALNKLLMHCLYGNSVGFSWWDPGLFSIPLLQEDSPLTGLSAKETSSTCELVPMVDMIASSDLKRRSLGPGERSTTDPQSLSKVAADVAGGGTDDTDQSLVLEHFKRSATLGATERSDLASSQLPSVVTPFDDLLPHVARVISLYETTAPNHPTLVFFRHLYDQLVHPDSEQPQSDALNRHALSLLEQSTSAGAEGSQPSQSNLMASMTALYDQCQKHLVAVNNPATRHRSRHRRLLPTRVSVRRKSHSRSLSTSGLCLPNSSQRASGTDASGGGGASTCAGSTVSAASSNKPESVLEESLPELLRAAASVLAAAATGSLRDPAGDGSDASDGRRGRHRRLSQSMVSASISMQRSNQSSGVASAFGGSQVSSSSMRSALTELHGPAASAVPTDMNTSVHDHQLTGKSISARPTGEDPVTLGSRMSLRSLSCASSSGAESYNSYRLLVNQAGASWRELWRTRMLLMDVLRWAEAVAPLAQANGTLTAGSATTGTKSTEPATHNPPPQPSDPIDWNARFASFLAAALSPMRPEQPCPNTVSASSQALIPSPLVTTTAAAQQHVGSPKVCDLTGGLASPAHMTTMDPMMAAAFAAATAAAATVAMQQQHLPTVQPHSLPPGSGLVSSPQTQTSRSQFIVPQQQPPIPVNPITSTQYDQHTGGPHNEFPRQPPMAFKSPYAVPRSHQATPIGSTTMAGPMHPVHFGPYTAYPFEWSTPVTPRFHPLSPTTYGAPAPYVHSSYGPGVAFRHPSLFGAPWPPTGAVVYSRQTLSAPDRMIHQYTPPSLDEEWHLGGGHAARYRGPPDLLLDHARVPGGAAGGPQVSHFTPSCTNSRIDPIVYLSPPLPPNQQHAVCVSHFMPHPVSTVSVPAQPDTHVVGEIAHSVGSHSLPLLRPDRTTAVTGRSQTHPLLATVPGPPSRPTKPTLSSDRLSKSPRSPPAGPDHDPADSDAFDSEDEVMSDEDQAVTDPERPEFHPVNQPPQLTAFVPFSPIPPSSAAYFLPQFHNLPHGADPTMGYVCAQPPVALIRSSPLAYSPTPADDGDVSSVSQSASQVPPRPSSNSSSSHSSSPGPVRTRSPPAQPSANEPSDQHNV